MNTPDPSPISKQEAEYEAWFHSEMEAALAEANDPNTAWVPHQTVMQDLLSDIAAAEAAGHNHATDLDAQREESGTDSDQPRRPD